MSLCCQVCLPRRCTAAHRRRAAGAPRQPQAWWTPPHSSSSSTPANPPAPATSPISGLTQRTSSSTMPGWPAGTRPRRPNRCPWNLTCTPPWARPGPWSRRQRPDIRPSIRTRACIIRIHPPFITSTIPGASRGIQATNKSKYHSFIIHSSDKTHCIWSQPSCIRIQPSRIYPFFPRKDYAI